MERDPAGNEGSETGDDPPPRAARLVAERLGPLVATAGTYATIEGHPGPVAVAREIRGLEPEARFTASAGTLGALVGVGGGDGSATAGSAVEPLPDGIGEGGVRAAARAVADALRSVRRSALERASDDGVDVGSDAREHLLVGLAAEKLLRAWAELAPALDDGDVDPRLASGAAALSAHLVLVAAGDLERFDGAARRDLLRYDAHDARRRGRAVDTDPSSLDPSAVERALWLQGAVLACERAGATAERGAALAGVPLAAFERALDRRATD